MKPYDEDDYDRDLDTIENAGNGVCPIAEKVQEMKT